LDDAEVPNEPVQEGGVITIKRKLENAREFEKTQGKKKVKQ
jgi:hypothetical protein